jgi:hypothetical protein
MRHAIPHQPRLAQARAGRDQRTIAGLEQVGLGVDRHQFARPQRRDAVGVRLQVVEQAHLLEAEFRLQPGRIDHPGKVRHLHAAALHRTRHAKTGMADR